MDPIKERVEWNKHHRKQLIYPQNGKYKDFLYAAHVHAGTWMANIFQGGENFVDYWPIFALINPYAPISSLIIDENNSITRTIKGECAIGYLLLTDRRVRIYFFESFSRIYHDPIYDGSFLIAYIKPIFLHEENHFLLKPIKDNIYFEQDLASFQMTPMRHEFSKDSFGVVILGRQIEILEVLENTLPDIYKWLYYAIQCADLRIPQR